MSRVYNFSAGPAVLPEEVSERSSSRNAGLQWNRNVGNGDESSFQGIRRNYRRLQKQDLRDLMNIPDNYKVLFLTGRRITSSLP